MRVQYPKCAYGPYCKLNLIQNGVYILVEVSFYTRTSLVTNARASNASWGFQFT